MINRLWKLFAFVSFSYTLSFEVASAQSYDCFEKEPMAGQYKQTYGLSYISTLVRSNNAYSNRYTELRGRNAYNVSKDGAVYVYYRGQKLLDDRSSKYVAVDTQVGYGHSLCLNKNFTASAGLLYAIPSNRELRKYDHGQGHIAVPTSVVWKSEVGLSLALRATTRRHFYKYTDNRGGKFLLAWAFEPGFSASYKIDKVTVAGYDEIISYFQSKVPLKLFKNDT
ncbi:MAG: hypothetical protein EOP04_28765 [Proteobacteria bacterium]|nr:MAG: hypothetical protein EOP04_28765 [Pseudomonadota bacterium]